MIIQTLSLAVDASESRAVVCEYGSVLNKI